VGLFITFEGLDGSGKSTQARLLYEELKKRKVPVLLTREPGGTRIGEQVRDTLHSTANAEMLPTTEILLYSASRAQLVGEFILPRLDEGYVVLCDRYVDSTFAYQGYGHGLNLVTLRQISEFATTGLRPDLTVYLDLEVSLSLSRRHNAYHLEAGELNRMDQQAVDFYRRVKQGYLELIAEDPNRWRTIDAAPASHLVYQSVRREVLPVVEDWLGGSLEVPDKAVRM
jgi:dTMP kinase